MDNDGSAASGIAGHAVRWRSPARSSRIRSRSRCRARKQHGNIWKTRILADTVVFFAGPQAFSFFMDSENFTRQNGSPKFLQDLLHPDAVPFLDGDRHRTRKRLLLTAFTDQAMESYLPGVFKRDPALRRQVGR